MDPWQLCATIVGRYLPWIELNGLFFGVLNPEVRGKVPSGIDSLLHSVIRIDFLKHIFLCDFLICQFATYFLSTVFTLNNFFIPFFIHIIKTPYWVFGFHDYKHHYRKDFYRLKSSSKWHYWKSELCSDYLYRDALWHYWIGANTCLTQRQWLDIIANKVYCCQKLIRYD